MRETLIPIFVVACLGVAVAVLLFPSEEERALMYIKDKEFSEALEIYEKLVQKGHLRPGPVKALTDLYVQYGEINRAIDLLEQFIAENPQHLEARVQIGTYYQYAQRPGDYLRNLEEIVKFAPTKERLKELSDIYNFNGDYEKQIDVLKQLIAYPDPEPEYFVFTAHLLAGRDRIDEAIAVLADYRNRFPSQIHPDTLEFMLSLLLSRHRHEEAFKWANDWFQIHPWPQAALRIAELFDQKGHPKMALSLLESVEPQAEDDVTFQITLLQYRYLNGQTSNIFSKLKEFSDKGKLPPEAFPIFIDLGLNGKDLTILVEESKRQDLTLLPDELLIRFVKQVTSEGNKDFLKYVLSQYDAIILDNRPLFAAELNFAGGDIEKSKEWAEIVLKNKDLPLEDNIRFIDLLARIDMKNKALERLEDIENTLTPQSRILQERDYVLLAKNFITLSRTKEGLNLFDKIKTNENKDFIDSGWALLAATEHQDEKVKDWFNAQEKFDPIVLEDIHRIVMKAGNYDFGLTTAQKLFELFPGTIQEMLLGRALLFNGKNDEAINHLKSHIYSFPEAEGMYAVALKRKGDEHALTDFMENQKQRENEGGGGRNEEFIYTILDFKEYGLALPYIKDLALTKGEGWTALYVDTGVKAGAIKEISDFLLEYLNKTDIDIKKKEEFVYVLIDIAGPEAALPHLKTLAYQVGGTWPYAYIDALKKLKKIDELRLFLKDWGLKSDTPIAMRRFAAHELLQGGMKNEAEQILMAISQIQSAKSQDIQDLLFIWGVGEKPERLQWLLARAEEAFSKNQMDEFGLWLNFVSDYASPHETLNYIHKKNIDPFKLGNQVVMAYIYALHKTKKYDVLEEILTRAIRKEHDPKNILELAGLAEEISEHVSAETAYVKIVGEIEMGYKKILRTSNGNGYTVAQTSKPRTEQPLNGNEKYRKIALRKLAFHAFTQKQLSESEKYLRLYITHYDPNDFEALYFLGECLWLTDRKTEAKYYYNRSLKVIEKQKKRTQDLLLVKAGIKQRYGFIDDAIDIYEGMRQELPSNRSLQADYALILIDNHREMMARNMLDMH